MSKLADIDYANEVWLNRWTLFSLTSKTHSLHLFIYCLVLIASEAGRGRWRVCLEKEPGTAKLWGNKMYFKRMGECTSIRSQASSASCSRLLSENKWKRSKGKESFFSILIETKGCGGKKVNYSACSNKDSEMDFSRWVDACKCYIINVAYMLFCI